MTAVNPIPEKVVNFNVYDEGEKLVGVAGEITLPNLEAMTETISGAGIAGEYESATPGHFRSITTEIPFRTILDHSFKLMVPGGRTITLRASQQSYDVAGGEIQHRGLKIVLKVMPKGLDLGKLAVGSPTDTKNSLEVLYIKIVENNKTLLELDKLNFIFIVNGIDVLAAIRDQI
jgi:P2 family phage contractile tail tube protein